MWKVFHHSYDQKDWLHVNHESGQWLADLMTNLHANDMRVLRHTEQFIEVLIHFPPEYDEYDDRGNLK